MLYELIYRFFREIGFRKTTLDASFDRQTNIKQSDGINTIIFQRKHQKNLKKVTFRTPERRFADNYYYFK